MCNTKVLVTFVFRALEAKVRDNESVASHGELGWEDQRKVNYQCWDTPCHRFAHNYIVFIQVVHGSHWRESDLLYFVLLRTSTLLYIDNAPRISCVIHRPKDAKAVNKGCLVKCQERSHSIGHTGSHVRSLDSGQCPSTETLPLEQNTSVYGPKG